MEIFVNFISVRRFYIGTITMLGGFAEGKVAGLPETDNLPEEKIMSIPMAGQWKTLLFPWIRREY